MKTKLYLLFFFVFPLFMSACRGDDPIPDPPVDGKRTVLVYMAADNSINPLASFTDGDLEELKAGMASIDNTSDMHLLVYIDTGFPRLIEIENKGGTVVETIVKEYEDRNSCGVAETQEVFNDVFGNSLYKAESYGLIYWSHGEGWIPTPLYNPQIQISVVSGTKRSIFRQKNKTKRSKKKAAHNTYKAGAKG